MKKILRYSFTFAFGGLGYAVIELLWRGRTHWTMMIAGGICFVLFSLIAEKLKHRRLLFKCALSASAVTGVELIFGIIFNVFLNMKIWDYSNQPFNFLGQICPLYTILWGVLALFFIPVAELLNKKMA